MVIIDATPQGVGWYPVNYMVRLAARLLEARVDVVGPGNGSSFATKVGSIVSRRKRSGREGENCLLICASPMELLRILEVPGWRKRFRVVAAWVFDSFWVEWIPATLRLSLPYDHLFITSGEDVDDWHRAIGVRPTWLPWGTDAMSLGSESASRRWDLTRVGRQPGEWDDDSATATAAASQAIRFQPRPVLPEGDPVANHLSLMKVYGESKYLLAFGNLANPTNYTHPTRQYITGRWVDALGGGAVVAGCAPRGACIDGLLWPGATLELGTTDRADGIAQIAAAVQRWTPEVASTNHRRALERLDWRLRLAEIAKVFGRMPEPLAHELAMLRARSLSASAQN